MAYKHLLFAVDLQPDDDTRVADRVKVLRDAMGAELSLVHVVEQLTYSYGEPFISTNYLEWQSELEEAAGETLAEIGKSLEVPKARQHLKIGRPQDLILSVADEIGADLIVMGSHGRKGLARLVLGSTANGVLQAAHCDVLAVRVTD